MKKLFYSLVMVLMLTACVAGPAIPPTPSVQIDIALSEITPIRQSMTALAQAGKITWAQDDQAQKSLTAIRSQLLMAQVMMTTNPKGAIDILSASLAALAAYQGANP